MQRLIQDRNNHLPYDGTLACGKISVSNAQKKNKDISKSKKSVRKILGDLTNSKNPHSQVSSFKQGKKVVVPKVSEKLQTGGRKALTDISNSVKIDESCNSFDEHDEGFMHNHEECIKAKKREEVMDLDCFWKTIGRSDIKLAPPLSHFSNSFKLDDRDTWLEEFMEIPESPERPKSRDCSYYYKQLEEEEDERYLDSLMIQSPDFKLMVSP
ncbi:uncharacterized protein LOC124912820 [Impatiens glandulifera]|uniref:uncharacterized protein LOC124912820 n=1 Tax=Impatiens glandulifera TaxID=253017 RepID=UPI001FB06B08|nr:uncharacterized protein LOC124912820 [Impatiens glandulifera]